MHEKLSEENFILYCAKRYDNPQLINTQEFIEDLDRLKYIKKLITRFIETGELKERLILNHIMTLYNCFGSFTSKIIFVKTEKQFSYVKPFLVMLNILPSVIYNVNDYKKIYTDDIIMNIGVINALRKIDHESRLQ